MDGRVVNPSTAGVAVNNGSPWYAIIDCHSGGAWVDHPSIHLASASNLLAVRALTIENCRRWPIVDQRVGFCLVLLWVASVKCNVPCIICIYPAWRLVFLLSGLSDWFENYPWYQRGFESPINMCTQYIRTATNVTPFVWSGYGIQQQDMTLRIDGRTSRTIKHCFCILNIYLFIVWG